MKVKQLIKAIISEALDISSGKELYEYGSQEHLNELDKLVTDIKKLKRSLRSGNDRLKHRKESARLQDAVTAIKFLKDKAKKEGIKKGLLEDDIV